LEGGLAPAPRRPRLELAREAPALAQASGRLDRAADRGVALLVRVEHAARPVEGGYAAGSEVGDRLGVSADLCERPLLRAQRGRGPRFELRRATADVYGER